MPAELTGALKTVLEQAAFAPVDDQAFLRISGSDATRWLNGMVTNSIQALEPGKGNYNFLLSAQGRIQGDCTIYRDPEAKEPAYLLQTDKSQIETIQELLDKFIIMDDVELTRLNHYDQGVLLLGADAPALLAKIDDPLLGDTLSGLPPLRIGYYRLTSEQVTTPVPGRVPQFLITADALRDDLMRSATESGAIQTAPEVLEQLRILEARPRYGTDIRDKDLPQETNQPHALHFAKGCYVGQEIVERIRSRGQVHRLFTPFRLEGGLPTSLPASLEANGKLAGELTSAATLETTDGPVYLALGYARREILDTHAPLTYSNGTAHPRPAGKLR